ncbi:ser/Thr protein phosphatase family protein-like protein [Massarina eburnea CBS 473.64]|uniref:Ser/Thr protein phosphatase family protein-like protein n=1 Tax=Massarina eburnea CBS 473.64 TaxID=1395130 RepID=A0A6A6RV00_9PLEO|nr:ser/Thr protein phosphatase family protein-like protein [Massarina eburnea CBS 473.64]
MRAPKPSQQTQPRCQRRRCIKSNGKLSWVAATSSVRRIARRKIIAYPTTPHTPTNFIPITMSASTARIKTRILIISDTHSASPLQNSENDFTAFRPPLPKADVLLHCGDLTMMGLMKEYKTALKMLKSIDAPLKVVIPGNHDISLDKDYYLRKGQDVQGLQEADPDMPRRAREFWRGEEAKEAGVAYLDEGSWEFTLDNGAKFTIYVSPYQPEFCDWAFPYWRIQDRYNPSDQTTRRGIPIASNPIPDFPIIDIIMTHGPPMGIRDETSTGEHVGCEHLLRAAWRCRPLLHCFGHIHEGWGAERVKWKEGQELEAQSERNIESKERIEIDDEKMKAERAAFVDISEESERPLERGSETLMVNASIMTSTYKPWQGPWVVDLDLEKQ